MIYSLSYINIICKQFSNKNYYVGFGDKHYITTLMY